MRIFVGLDLEDEIRARIAEFITEMRTLAPEVRWVSPESLHVTLKFIGEKPDEAVRNFQGALRSVFVPPFEISFRGCGFFPAAKSARVFWVGIAAPATLADLAAKIDDALEQLGIPKETRAFSPHLTLARAGSGAPARNKHDRADQRFTRLQEKLAKIPDPEFGTMTAREFFLYRSQLSSQGSQYTKISRFELRSSQT